MAPTEPWLWSSARALTASRSDTTRASLVPKVMATRSGAYTPPPSVRNQTCRCDDQWMTSGNAARPPCVQPQLSVRNGRAAVDFYKAAFGAVEVFRFGGNDDLNEVVAQLAVGNALFWVEDESPPHGNFSPVTVGGATTRMLLIVDDPEAVVQQAVAAGGSEINPVSDEHGWRLGRIDDPFGHRWEIATPIGAWPP